MIAETRMRLIRKWLIIFAICTAIALFTFSTILAEHRLDKEPLKFQYPLINELTGAYTAFLLVPLLLAVMTRFRITKQNWYSAIPVHLGFTVLFGLAHTSLMTISRIFLYDAFGLEPYDAGNLFNRYFMEYHKQFLIYCFVFAAHMGLTHYASLREKERETADLKLNTEQLRVHLTQSKLESLKGQLQPHFLFNTLNMISSFMYQDAKKADRMISRLSTLLRFSLETSETQKIPLRREMEAVRLYLEIMQARFEDTLSVKIDIPDPLLEALVPGFLLQPLIENAIKHAPPENQDRTFIEFSGKALNDRLLLSVTDNGPGMSESYEKIMRKGVGLSNTSERLKQLYGSAATLELSNRAAGGLQVLITLPLEYGSSEQPSVKVS